MQYGTRLALTLQARGGVTLWVTTSTVTLIDDLIPDNLSAEPSHTETRQNSALHIKVTKNELNVKE